ncbi:hypothetical protein K435DRAFT_880709 [Dendrothele bispora CBS 962.96]|uniref:Uncharacterized protein n=1 Tax=Dendrothele bispora (strain CBS 962.96) TaxID=1314807 RepID=A0A4S8KJ79_DENBC|nr:hypothetical protein K435DRAFT_880709 [Dendrothele bispora CBS 962.96]
MQTNNTISTVDSLLDLLPGSGSTALPLLLVLVFIFAVMHLLISLSYPCLTIAKLDYSLAQLNDMLGECREKEVPIMAWVTPAVNRLRFRHSGIRIESNNLRFSCTIIWRYLRDLMHVTYAIVKCHQDVYAVNVSLKNSIERKSRYIHHYTSLTSSGSSHRRSGKTMSRRGYQYINA